MKNKDVASAWAAGKPARTKNLRTDGEALYSYRLLIGITVCGKKVALDYRRKVSNTTSMHCGLAVAVSDRVESPPS